MDHKQLIYLYDISSFNIKNVNEVGDGWRLELEVSG